ncbi:MAG: flagellar biosynthetic protein FliQ [Bdellovibrionales bacterium]|nr:flagellar biosynthetic protein FliQ [Bdellovibrionales bacterium]
MMVSSYLTQSIILVTLISGIPLILCTCMSLVVALVQATTQVQEQSIGFLVKVITVSATLFVCGNFFWDSLIEFLQTSLRGIQYIG